MTRWVIGVDEAGRGPLAGPLAVGFVMVRSDFDIKKHFPGVADSKLLTPEKRDELYELIRSFVRMSESGEVRFCVRFASHLYIDKVGLTRAVRRSIYSGVVALAPSPQGVEVFLDGLLHAPPHYAQQTVIRGDQLVPVISLASIVAKVTRDRLMTRLAKKYPVYGFDAHKGYPTKKHYQALTKWGPCDIHRRSFRLIDAPI